jgi:hypothetical protein
MRYKELMELTGVKRFHDMTATEVLDQFRATYGNGPIKLLGQGANGAAVMIGDSVYKFWLLDSAYTAFVQYCKTHESNPLLPKFTSQIKKMPAFFIRHADAPDYVNFVKMEKLASNRSILNYRFDLKYQPYEEQFAEIDDGEVDITTIKLATALFYFDRLQDSEIPILTQFTKYLSGYHHMNYKPDILGDELKLFLTTLHDIKQLGFTLDLHDENFIMRDDQLVILDPIANTDDLMLNRAFYKFDEKLFRDENEGKKAMKSNASKTSMNNMVKPNTDNTPMDDLDAFMKSKGHQ